MKAIKDKSFFVKLIKSIKNFDFYKEISNEKVSKCIKYFIILIILYSIVVTIGIAYNINKTINESRNFIQTEINEINYSNGILKINNDEYKSWFNDYIIIDTSKQDTQEYENNANIVFGKSHCFIKMNDYTMKFKYSDLIFEDFNKDDILRMLSNKNEMYFVIFIIFMCIIVILAISTMLDILIIALIGLIISKLIGNNKLKFENLFKLAIHSITLPVVLGMIYYLINTFIGFYIKYFSTMYTSIATIYMVTSILLITVGSNEKHTENS